MWGWSKRSSWPSRAIPWSGTSGNGYLGFPDMQTQISPAASAAL